MQFVVELADHAHDSKICLFPLYHEVGYHCIWPFQVWLVNEMAVVNLVVLLAKSVYKRDSMSITRTKRSHAPCED